jgi:hypothetical protein
MVPVLLPACYTAVVNLYRFLADLVLVLHTAFIAFVLFGLVAIFIGMAKHWQWTRNIWFRVAHLAGIGYVVVQDEDEVGQKAVKVHDSSVTCGEQHGNH